MKFSQIVAQLGALASQNSLSLHADRDPDITAIASVENAAAATISYIEGEKFASEISTTGASALILPPDAALQSAAEQRGIAWIVTRQPKLAFAKTVTFFYQPFQPAPEIHPTAVIHPTAQIGRDVYLGPHAVVQANVTLGDGVCVHPNVVIYPDVEVGDRTVLHANCVIHERAKIGADCVIHCGAVIGSEGFGFVPTAEGWFKLEQSGYTVLEDGVEVGCNSTIDRPAIGETRIGHHTKIDNLVQIGHGTQVGWGCALAAQVGLAGAVEVGDRAILAGQVGIANQVKVGKGATVTAKSGAIADIEPGALVSGIPTRPHKAFLKISVLLTRLPELFQTVKKLQQQLEQLSKS